MRIPISHVRTDESPAKRSALWIAAASASRTQFGVRLVAQLQHRELEHRSPVLFEIADSQDGVAARFAAFLPAQCSGDRNLTDSMSRGNETRGTQKQPR